jgi:hypothetical protein
MEIDHFIKANIYLFFKKIKIKQASKISMIQHSMIEMIN